MIYSAFKSTEKIKKIRKDSRKSKFTSRKKSMRYAFYRQNHKSEIYVFSAFYFFSSLKLIAKLQSYRVSLLFEMKRNELRMNANERANF